MSRKRSEPPVHLPPTWLHIYAQSMWHSDAVLEGTREGLRAVRDAIDEALRTNREGISKHLVAGDGEGYSVVARVRTAEQIREGALPYVDDIARDPRTRAAG